MTDVSTPGASARLYSQTPFDERGNFHYAGDLYQAGDDLATLAARIEGHLKTKFPDTRFAIRTDKFAGGRKITAEILDTPADLTARDVQNDFFVAVRDQMERFGFTRSNLYQDFHNCSFYCEARIGQAYWAALAGRRGPKNPGRNGKAGTSVSSPMRGDWPASHLIRRGTSPWPAMADFRGRPLTI